MADFRLSPPSMNDSEPKMDCPMRMVSTNRAMGPA